MTSCVRSRCRGHRRTLEAWRSAACPCGQSGCGRPEITDGARHILGVPGRPPVGNPHARYRMPGPLPKSRLQSLRTESIAPVLSAGWFGATAAAGELSHSGSCGGRGLRKDMPRESGGRGRICLQLPIFPVSGLYVSAAAKIASADPRSISVVLMGSFIFVVVRAPSGSCPSRGHAAEAERRLYGQPDGTW